MSDFCRVPELALAETAQSICRWPDNEVTWTLQAILPGMTLQSMIAALQPWFSQWKRVRVRYVERAVEARVLVGARHIDGQNGVLADCFLPCGNVRQVKLQFDLGDNWTLDRLGRVARHEFGHAIGLGHAPQSSPNWMAPFLNNQNAAGPWDLAEEARRYPQIIPPIPDPVPIPNPGGGGMGFLDFLAKIAPILDLLKDPRFLELLDLVVSLFGGKKALTADDLDHLAANLTAKAQQIRSNP